MSSFSLTSFLNGKINLYQPQKGYRFSVDAPLLADFISPEGNEIMFEMGSGCGIIPIILNSRGKGGKKIITVEIQEELYNIARKNVEINGFNKKIEILHGDVKKIYQRFSDSFDIVFSNPPYNKIEENRVGDNLQKIIACHEVHLNLNDIFKISSWILKKEGSLYLIFTYERRSELIEVGKKFKFSLNREKFVFSKKGDKKPHLILTEFRKKFIKTPLKDKNLFIYTKNKKYTEDFLKIIS